MIKQMQRWQAITCRAVAPTAQTAPDNTSPDQRGWKTFEHFAPLLHLPAAGELIVSGIFQVFHETERYGPPMHVEMYNGVSPMALIITKAWIKIDSHWGCMVAAIVSLPE